MHFRRFFSGFHIYGQKAVHEAVKTMFEENNNQITIGSIATFSHTTTPETPISRLFEILKSDDPVSAVVVLNGPEPVGLVMSMHLDRVLSQRYGFSVYYNRSVGKIMDRSPMIIDHTENLSQAADVAMKRETKKIYDHIIVTRDKALLGTVSIRRLLIALNDEQRQNTLELEAANRQLKEALGQIKTLQGLLPICSVCKKIRDDKGYWNQIEHYISEHSEAQFSHGICPPCAKKLYPELKLYSA
ncbi:MAG: CBS domain-containing protein [Desulfobacteraceae bacterium]|nr:MAG: CBS domain-containing protein [Desulfobacteraceae bacterium]